jgi:hypothetical protein
VRWIPERGFIADADGTWFEIIIWEFSVKTKAKSLASARYQTWLEFHDSYDISFIDFCKACKVRKAA